MMKALEQEKQRLRGFSEALEKAKEWAGWAVSLA